MVTGLPPTINYLRDHRLCETEAVTAHSIPGYKLADRSIGAWRWCPLFFFLLFFYSLPQLISQFPNRRLDVLSFPGSDIMAKVQAAFASCSAKCVVEIPAGRYTATTTLSLPLPNLSAYDLVLDAGAFIQFNGLGWWLDTYEVQPNPAAANLTIEGNGTVVGNPLSPGAIRLLPTNNIEIKGVSLRDFIHGDLIQVNGTEHVNIHNTVLVNAVTGVRVQGINCMNGAPYTCSSSMASSGVGCTGRAVCGYAGNMVHMDQNAFGFFSEAAFLEDSGNGMARYEHLSDTFTHNEVNGGTTGVWARYSRSLVVSGNYFESQARHFLILGQKGFGVVGAVISGNYFTSSLSFTIELAEAADSLIQGNSENGSGSECMVNMTSAFRILYQSNHVEGTNAVCVNGKSGPVFTRQKAPTIAVLGTGAAASYVVAP